jgi:peptidoglycan-associated lipoprotein
VDIRSDQQNTIQRDAAFLTQYPNMNFTIEGNCDERGSIECNLALGDKRDHVKKPWLRLTSASANIKTFSYGKEKRVCTEHDEPCWQQNRHDHFNHER